MRDLKQCDCIDERGISLCVIRRFFKGGNPSENVIAQTEAKNKRAMQTFSLFNEKFLKLTADMLEKR